MLTAPGPDRNGSTIGLLSTYPPTQCGLATFTAALKEHLTEAGSVANIVRVLDHPSPAGSAVDELVNGSHGSAIEAVDALNRNDVVIVQHEYGIYGGPDGRDVIDLVNAVTVPVVVVFHTVLEQPTGRQRLILELLLERADVAVTMTETARQRLIDLYAADPHQVTTIAHGAADNRDVLPRDKTPGRPLVLTWGLLGPGKGIEWAIDAMAGLRDLSPRYLVLGKTHPKVAERHGETYRTGLMQRARDRGVADLIEFDDSYLPVRELAAIVAAADVVLLPYDSREQVTSGVLTEAVAAGRPVVSTGFPHAVELLQDGPGLVVPQRDSDAITVALRTILTDADLAAGLAERARQRAPELFWSAVAGRYQQIVDDLVGADLVVAR